MRCLGFRLIPPSFCIHTGEGNELYGISLKEASSVYALFGLEGLDGVEFPPADTPVGKGVLRYHMRTGKHDITYYDWEQYLRYADELLKN